MTFPVGNITEEIAREHCFAVVYGSAAGAACMDYAPFDLEIQGCVADIKVSSPHPFKLYIQDNFILP